MTAHKLAGAAESSVKLLRRALFFLEVPDQFLGGIGFGKRLIGYWHIKKITQGLPALAHIKHQ